MAKFPTDPAPPPAPDVCDIDADAGTYQLAGTYSACAMCNNSAAALWDGKWSNDAGIGCEWSPDITAGTRIGNKNIHTLVSQLILDIVAGVGTWRVRVNCELGGFASLNTWTGSKTTGPNADGIYTRDSGCDLTATRVMTRLT